MPAESTWRHRGDRVGCSCPLQSFDQPAAGSCASRWAGGFVSGGGMDAVGMDLGGLALAGANIGQWQFGEEAA